MVPFLGEPFPKISYKVSSSPFRKSDRFFLTSLKNRGEIRIIIIKIDIIADMGVEKKTAGLLPFVIIKDCPKLLSNIGPNIKARTSGAGG